MWQILFLYLPTLHSFLTVIYVVNFRQIQVPKERGDWIVTININLNSIFTIFDLIKSVKGFCVSRIIYNRYKDEL